MAVVVVVMEGGSLGPVKAPASWFKFTLLYTFFSTYHLDGGPCKFNQDLIEQKNYKFIVLFFLREVVFSSFISFNTLKFWDFVRSWAGQLQVLGSLGNCSSSFYCSVFIATLPGFYLLILFGRILFVVMLMFPDQVQTPTHKNK